MYCVAGPYNNMSAFLLLRAKTRTQAQHSVNAWRRGLKDRVRWTTVVGFTLGLLLGFSTLLQVLPYLPCTAVCTAVHTAVRTAAAQEGGEPSGTVRPSAVGTVCSSLWTAPGSGWPACEGL